MDGNDRPLTQPQKLLLMELVRQGRQHVSETWAPARNLVNRGFAVWEHRGLDTYLAATQAGEAHYEAIGKKDA